MQKILSYIFAVFKLKKHLELRLNRIILEAT